MSLGGISRCILQLTLVYVAKKGGFIFNGGDCLTEEFNALVGSFAK